MPEIGKFNQLTVMKKNKAGIILDGLELGEIFLSQKEITDLVSSGDVVDVFLYTDSDDTIAATTRKPLGEVGSFALLKAVSVNQVGAFLDWGLPKDLFVPFRMQKSEMEEGKEYVVRIYLDEHSGRIAGSSKVDKFLHKTPVSYKDDQEVALFIASKTDTGYNAIINNAHWGVIYENEVFRKLKRGERLTGYIKKIRSDWKIDLTLHKPGYGKVTDFEGALLKSLQKEGGFIPISDNSTPEEINQRYHISKKTFKKAVGALYRKRLISIEYNGIRLTETTTNEGQ